MLCFTFEIIKSVETGLKPLEKVTFIHYKDGSAKIAGSAGKAPTCYKLLGVKWNSLPVGYVINPGSSDPINVGFVTDAIAGSAKTWDIATSKKLFNDFTPAMIDYTATYDDTVEDVDYRNEYVFGPISSTNVIAVTNIWYTRFGKQIVDYDVMFNTYYTWKNCNLESCAHAMDLQNIATHETGHGLGLGDIYTNSCSAVTMYGYSRYGETAKRSLESADIMGLQRLYGA